MADYTFAEESIGTDGRDRTTVASWESALANGADTIQTGVMHADSVFDEKDVIISTPETASLQTILRAEEGDLPIIRPASGSATRIIRLEINNTRQVIIGLTIDGVNLTGGSRFGLNSSVANVVLVGIVSKNNAGFGIGVPANQSSSLLYCLSFGNAADGYIGPANSSQLICCGAAKNGGVGILTFQTTCDLEGCWFLDNTGDDISGTNTRRFVYVSDTSIPAGDDIFRSQVFGTLGFTDFPNDDYTLAVGSTLLKKAFITTYYRRLAQTLITLQQFGDRDAFGNKPGVSIGTRLNVGPFQAGVAAVPLPDTPTLVHKSTP